MDNINPTQAQLASRVQDSAPSTITPESLQPVTPIQLPQQNTSSNSSSYNTSIPNPTIPTAESIINTNTNPTPAETQQTGFLNKIASLISGNKTQTTLQNDEETKAGLPALTTTLNDLNTQLEGLNNQATALQNDAQYTIPNKAQQDATGRGITAGGLAPLTTAQLRDNQIKQGAIATQALTLKSAIYGAQGKYNIAKDAADKAATAQYEQQQQQIDYQKAQLDAIMPTLNKEEKAQALIQQSKLADRQTAINNGIEDKKTIIALATATLKNYPDDSAAHYAAQQALAESNKDKPDLATVLNLVGKYQTDPMATQKAVLDLEKQRADIRKTNADTLKASTTGSNTAGTSPELLQAINSGTIDPNKVNSRTVGIYNAIAKAGVDAVGSHAGASGETKAVTDLATYKSTATRTLGVIDKNLPLVANLADKVNQTGVPGLDQFISGQKAYLGNNLDVIKYVNSLKTLRSEYAQMLSKGNAPTESDKSEAAQAIPAGLSSAGYNALGEQLKLEATNIISASNDAIATAKDKSASNNGSANTIIPTAQIPSGYYQASDGLLYKK